MYYFHYSWLYSPLWSERYHQEHRSNVVSIQCISEFPLAPSTSLLLYQGFVQETTENVLRLEIIKRNWLTTESSSTVTSLRLSHRVVRSTSEHSTKCHMSIAASQNTNWFPYDFFTICEQGFFAGLLTLDHLCSVLLQIKAIFISLKSITGHGPNLEGQIIWGRRMSNPCLSPTLGKRIGGSR